MTCVDDYRVVSLGEGGAIVLVPVLGTIAHNYRNGAARDRSSHMASFRYAMNLLKSPKILDSHLEPKQYGAGPNGHLGNPSFSISRPTMLLLPGSPGSQKVAEPASRRNWV